MEQPTSFNGSTRRVVALIGTGVGPRVAVRSENARLRVCGLTRGKVSIHLDHGVQDYTSSGEFDLPPSEFARVEAKSETPVVCEILMGGARDE